MLTLLYRVCGASKHAYNQQFFSLHSYRAFAKSLSLPTRTTIQHPSSLIPQHLSTHRRYTIYPRKLTEIRRSVSMSRESLSLLAVSVSLPSATIYMPLSTHARTTSHRTLTVVQPPPTSSSDENKGSGVRSLSFTNSLSLSCVCARERDLCGTRETTA